VWGCDMTVVDSGLVDIVGFVEVTRLERRERYGVVLKCNLNPGVTVKESIVYFVDWNPMMNRYFDHHSKDVVVMRYCQKRVGDL
jgi:hypothetical protein